MKRWESYVSRYEKKLKDKLDDEMKLAGLAPFVPEELEKHLILDSNRLRTLEDARLEVVTYVKAKFGVIIRDSKPSETGSRGHSDSMDVDAVNSLSFGKGRGSSSPRDGFCKCAGAHFQRDCNARTSTGKQSSGRGKQSKLWFESEGKCKRTRRNPKGNLKEPKVRKASTMERTRKLVSQVLKTRNRTQARKLRNLHKHVPLTTPWFHDGWNGAKWNDGWSFDEWNGDWSSVGWHEGWEQRMTLLQAHFQLEAWMSVPPEVRSGLNG